ncbi:hypothetical protein HMPREF9065_01270 [Aggregatibacter sp. oral taxon 458 str. W10330]|jgi:hypothetical protein|uniref:hypothetical protein n=1 Tax=Aggregatibacter sp. oral taxon 458 TaxID=712148 RepID=UPI000396892A|nr:hypothetical protein [Aggregatibacter sp. oral taxon 458]ERH27214.1 hypothetical protein HMPREF9065_01270 [Aggregatibacter sp. oral taxon 458 str. W10330]
MFSTFDVYIAEASDENLERDLLKRFIVTYLTQDDLDKLKMILTNIPQLRPFWGKTGYKYITINNIYFLYEVAEDERKVIILGAKFNNKQKTFNFANTLKQQKTMKKWIENYPKYYPNK